MSTDSKLPGTEPGCKNTAGISPGMLDESAVDDVM